jgi:hypothetical protein
MDKKIDDKPAVGLVAALMVVPVALCCLGPIIFAIFASGLGGIASWFGGLGFAGAAAATLAIGVIAYALIPLAESVPSPQRARILRRCGLHI